MVRYLFAFMVILVGLTGCGEEENPLFGTWKGTITPEISFETGIPMKEGSDELIVDFFKDAAVINGKTYTVEYEKNVRAHFVYEVGTNRAINIQFENDNLIKMRIPGVRKQGLHLFHMTRVPGS